MANINGFRVYTDEERKIVGFDACNLCTFRGDRHDDNISDCSIVHDCHGGYYPRAEQSDTIAQITALELELVMTLRTVVDSCMSAPCSGCKCKLVCPSLGRLRALEAKHGV